jgi:hypothetical protein
MKANEAKLEQVTFTLNKLTCPPVKLNNEQLPQADEVKYLGIHLDRRLTWRKHNYQTKAIGPQTTKPILNHWSQISAITRKQASCLQSNSKACLDIWSPAGGKCIQLQSRDTRANPVKSATNNNRRSMVYA